MNAELSRRVAQVIEIMIKNGLNINSRIKLAKEVDSVNSFNELSTEIKNAILSAEKYNDVNKKQNELYSAFETIKLNYKCPKGTVDDTNACGLEGQESKTDIKISYKLQELQESISNEIDTKNVKSMLLEGQSKINAMNTYSDQEKELRDSYWKLKEQLPKPDGISIIKSKIIDAGGVSKFVKSTNSPKLTEELHTKNRNLKEINENIINDQTFYGFDIKPYKQDSDITFSETGLGLYGTDNARIIAYVNDVPVGYVAKDITDPSEPGSTVLEVATEFQNKGIGKKLLLEYYDKFPEMVTQTGGLTNRGKKTFISTLKSIEKNK
jgi:hypothetical protein